ncbi:MAG: 4Fe-4S dicluster domain-containing protein, partial [Coriobacteriia bacterium]|nr:4Fe-4S dicluster domain-containing protein [Coriobacteriia bacterium]
GRLGLTKVQRDSAICIDCGVCNRECPSRLDVATAGRVVDDHCTMCAECVDACPVPGALTITTGSEKESLRPVAIGLVSALLLLALIGTAQTLGWWQSGSGCGGCSEAPQAQSVASASTPADSPLE